jgi:hypothetical protein
MQGLRGETLIIGLGFVDYGYHVICKGLYSFDDGSNVYAE